MNDVESRSLTRRELLIVAGSAAALGCTGGESVLLDAGGSPDASPMADGGAPLDPDGNVPGLDGGAAVDAPITPSCVETEPNILGPAYVEGAPMRSDGDLNPLDWPGTPLVVTGRVVSARGCTPLAGAELDFWQADDGGCYDGSPIGCGPLSPEWPLRGRVVTDADGRYTVRTIYPGLYPGRTRHIHVIIRAAGQRELTTQIYFTGEPANATDGAILPSLTIDLATDAGGALSGAFDVVLAPA